MAFSFLSAEEPKPLKRTGRVKFSGDITAHFDVIGTGDGEELESNFYDFLSELADSWQRGSEGHQMRFEIKGKELHSLGEVDPSPFATIMPEYIEQVRFEARQMMGSPTQYLDEELNR